MLENEQKWDWYCLKSPNVVRRHSKSPSPLPQRRIFPGVGEPLVAGWRRTSVPGYQDVQWKLSDRYLAVNGIAVNQGNTARASIAVNVRTTFRIFRFALIILSQFRY